MPSLQEDSEAMLAPLDARAKGSIAHADLIKFQDARRDGSGASRYSTIDHLHTASFDGCVRSQTGRIQLSAQLVGVKSIILESV